MQEENKIKERLCLTPRTTSQAMPMPMPMPYSLMLCRLMLRGDARIRAHREDGLAIRVVLVVLVVSSVGIGGRWVFGHQSPSGWGIANDSPPRFSGQKPIGVPCQGKIILFIFGPVPLTGWKWGSRVVSGGFRVLYI